MQCPKCGYEPTLKELQSSPGDCVACGVNFDKYQQIQAREAEAAAQRKASAANLANVSPVVRAAMHDYPGAQPVVVVDLKMSFWSMVKFMVKWAFASIPAVLIIFTICAALAAVWSVVMGLPGYGKKTFSSQAEPANSTYLDIPTDPDVAYFLLKLDKSPAGFVEMQLKRNAPAGVTYQLVSVDCSARTISLDADSPSYSEMLSSWKSAPKHSPGIGTTDDFLISKACR